MKTTANTLELLIADESIQLSGGLEELWVGMVVGALSADPFTWDELWYALGRFVETSDLPTDLGLTRREIPTSGSWTDLASAGNPDCIVDLPGRMLLTTWDQINDPIPACKFDHSLVPGQPIQYFLGPSWLVSSELALWPREVHRRRAEQRARWSLDARVVLYGTPMLTFLIEHSGRWAELLRTVDTTPGGSPNRADWWDVRSAAARKLYQQWLDQRPDSLGGRSVRDVLHDDHDHLSADMCSRQSQWSTAGQAPCQLRETDTAYRFAGFGTHESILYDQLFGVLVDAYLTRIEPLGRVPSDMGSEVDWLRQRRDEWLWLPDSERLMGKAPRGVIDQERRRLPLAVDNSHDIGHDDCPLCQMMMSPEYGPVFYHLDGCYTPLTCVRKEFDDGDDDDDDDSHDFDESPDGDDIADEPGPAVASGQADTDINLPAASRSNSIWKRVGIFTPPGESSAAIELFTIAACAGELVEDLKERSADRDSIDLLIRQVGNLSAALRNAGSDLVGPVIARFGDCLDELQRAYPDLTDKVEDLQSRLLGLIELAND